MDPKNTPPDGPARPPHPDDLASDTCPRGSLILVEGLDRSGKTTLAQTLVTELRRTGHTVLYTSYPTRTGPIGSLISQYLRGESQMDARTMHLLFSADRWHEADVVRQMLDGGSTIVMDRYSYSGIAYSVANGLPRAWAESTERGLPKPDVTLFLDLAPEIAATRGQYGEELYERAPLQRRVRKVFHDLVDGTWHIIDAEQSEEQVAEEALDVVMHVVHSSAHRTLSYFD